MNGCCFRHDNIDTLYGVTPMPHEKLPRVCSCGELITYADEVVFIPFPTMESIPGVLEVVELDFETLKEKK